MLDARRRSTWIHAPDSWAQVDAARKRRYRFEEALVTQLVLARRRRGAARHRRARPRAGGDGGLLAAFDARLPFELTDGPARGRAEIEARPRASPTR